MYDSLGRLPKEPVDRFTKPFMRFLQIEAAGGAVLLLCTLFALAVSNSPWSGSFLSFWEIPAGFHLGGVGVSRSLKHWINDGLMTLFFFLVALELKREIVLGELRSPRLASFSLAAALGGMILPASIFLLLAGGGAGADGWGTVMATDTAFVIGCLALLGSRIPQTLRLFLLSLAIFDDVGAILVVAIGYGSTLNWAALGLTGLGLAGVVGISLLGIRSIPVYFVSGSLVWIAMDASGIHPTLVGVILGLMTPARSWVSDNRLRAILNRVVASPPGERRSGDTTDRQDLRRASVATREALSPVERLEIALHPWVAFAIMPLFALANAGVVISRADADGALVMAIVAGFVFGKPIGVLLFSSLAVSLRLAIRPSELSWSLLAAGSILTGIGFTMALFIAELAFDSNLLTSAKLGILGASVGAGLCGVLALAWLTSPSRR
jgi:NhaA family Na+:H+ antiporter